MQININTRNVLKALGVLALVAGLIYSYKYVHDRGVELGIKAYHAQCLIGGFLVDEEGQAVACGPLSHTAPPAEKENYKDKVKALSLFN